MAEFAEFHGLTPTMEETTPDEFVFRNTQGGIVRLSKLAKVESDISPEPRLEEAIVPSPNNLNVSEIECEDPSIRRTVCISCGYKSEVDFNTCPQCSGKETVQTGTRWSQTSLEIKVQNQ